MPKKNFLKLSRSFKKFLKIQKCIEYPHKLDGSINTENISSTVQFTLRCPGADTSSLIDAFAVDRCIHHRWHQEGVSICHTHFVMSVVNLSGKEWKKYSLENWAMKSAIPSTNSSLKQLLLQHGGPFPFKCRAGIDLLSYIQTFCHSSPQCHTALNSPPKREQPSSERKGNSEEDEAIDPQIKGPQLRRVTHMMTKKKSSAWSEILISHSSILSFWHQHSSSGIC